VIEHGKRLLRIAIGGALLLVGLALCVPGIPGPGIAVVVLGLSVLSTDFEFARRWMTRLKNGARRVLRRDRDLAL
jgi:tellurite resistance protein TerC